MLGDLREYFNKKIGNIKIGIKNIKNQPEIRNTITEKKNLLKGINSRLDKVAENTQT